jgi:RNA-directed DNA polymerase
MGELKSSNKPFDISKREVWEAWEKVKANKGAPGVDGRSVEGFEADLRNNLYRYGTGCPQGVTFRLRCGRWRYQSRTVGE